MKRKRANRFALERPVNMPHELTADSIILLRFTHSMRSPTAVEQPVKISVPLVSKIPSEALALNLSESCPSLTGEAILASRSRRRPRRT